MGFNRPTSLQRLLDSLAAVESTTMGADLLVSIDGEGDPRCTAIAEKMQWKHGSVRTCAHPRNLGLKSHVELCSDLVANFDCILILEDDLTVSPWMLHYCREAVEYYQFDSDVAQISLYSPKFNEFGHVPFEGVIGRHDVFATRVPSSWGQIYTRDAWTAYRKWTENSPVEIEEKRTPRTIDSWTKSWKRNFFEYVSMKKKWVIYPRVSLTTNHADPGTNFGQRTRLFEVPIETDEIDYRLAAPAALARYDEWLQPTPENFPAAILENLENVAIDLSGTKPLIEIKEEYLLSIKECRRPIKQYSARNHPPEINIHFQSAVREDDIWHISLGKTVDFEDKIVGPQFFRQYAPLDKAAVEQGYLAGALDVRNGIRYRIGKAALSPVNLAKRIFRRSHDRQG